MISSSGVSVIIVADTWNNRIRLITPTGVVTTLAGSGIGAGTGKGAFADGTGTSASFFQPWGVAVIPSNGAIAVADTFNNRIRLVTPAGVVTTLAGNASQAFADGTGSSAAFHSPRGITATQSNSTIVVADTFNDRIRLVTGPPALPACDATWHHVALTYSPSASLSAFIDGALTWQQSATITLPEASVSTLRVGGSLFAGALSELRIYNRTLLPSEVVALSQLLPPSLANGL